MYWRAHPPYRKLALSLAVVLVVLGIIALGIAWFLSPTQVGSFTLEVRPGTGTGVISEELKRRGLVRDATVFRLVLTLVGNAGRVRDGLYDVSGSMSTVEIARLLGTGGRPRVVRVVIPEGWRAEEIATRLEQFGLGERKTFLAAFAKVELARELLGVELKGSLEGVLFPASYLWRPEASVDEIVRGFLQRFRQELRDAARTRLQALGLSVPQWVTLASIVQSEAANKAEMSAIAGVFLNRLERGMRLQSDPTVAYGLGKMLPELSRPAGDFQKDTPYNTYTRAGLPIGPICNPGAAALEAVLEPKRTLASGAKALYFLHGRKGEFRLNSSFQAHLKDVARFR